MKGRAERAKSAVLCYADIYGDGANDCNCSVAIYTAFGDAVERSRGELANRALGTRFRVFASSCFRTLLVRTRLTSFLGCS